MNGNLMKVNYGSIKASYLLKLVLSTTVYERPNLSIENQGIGYLKVANHSKLFPLTILLDKRTWIEYSINMKNEKDIKNLKGREEVRYEKFRLFPNRYRKFKLFGKINKSVDKDFK